MSWRPLVFWVCALGAVVYGLTAPNATGFPNNELARIIFFHLPCALLAFGLLVHGAWTGFRYLRTGETGFDARNAAATELALVFAALTMATGVLFSKVQWNAWWQNDPRQTSFLIVLLLCAAGVALRAGLQDERKSAKASAAYSVATILPQVFLIFALPRILESFHPSDTIVSGKLDGPYGLGVLFVLGVLVAAVRTLYVERVRTLESHNETRNDPRHAGLAGDDPVRPTAVPRGGSQTDD